jgi:hypothetical protein
MMEYIDGDPPAWSLRGIGLHHFSLAMASMPLLAITRYRKPSNFLLPFGVLSTAIANNARCRRTAASSSVEGCNTRPYSPSKVRRCSSQLGIRKYLSRCLISRIHRA